MDNISVQILMVLIFAPVVFWWLDLFLESPLTRIFYGLVKTAGTVALCLTLTSLFVNVGIVYELLSQIAAILLQSSGTTL